MPKAGDIVICHFFGEDRAHAEFVTPVIARIARQERLRAIVEVRSERGGWPVLQTRLAAYQLAARKGAIERPDVLFIAADLNCRGNERRREIEALIEVGIAPCVVLACPDPHIELWYIADKAAFKRVVDVTPEETPWKCDRAEYKRQLADAVARGEFDAPQGGIEFGRDLAEVLDPYQTGKVDRGFARFWQDTENAFRSIRPAIVESGRC